MGSDWMSSRGGEEVDEFMISWLSDGFLMGA